MATFPLCQHLLPPAEVIDYPIPPRIGLCDRQPGLSVEHPQIAVLVQQLVAANVAVVVFSANPITGNRDEIMINAGWGLGESIAGGTVTPETFIVHKSDLAVA